MLLPIAPIPTEWKKAWSLHRRQKTTDSYGDPKESWDMENPDFSAEAGTDGAVAWQADSDGESLGEPGETASGSATGRIFDASLEISEFDRVQFDGAVWEVRSVETWPSFRSVRVVKMA